MTPSDQNGSNGLPGWDLSHLLEGREVEDLLEEADRLAAEFAEAHEGKVAELDAEGLREAMESLARISELVGRAGSYAQLWFTTDTADPKRGALLQMVTERATSIQTKVLFF